MLAVGILAELQKEDYGDVSSSVLTSPAIVCILIGSLLFLIGLLGAVGALVELYYVLITVSGYDIKNKLVCTCLYLFPVVCDTYFHHTGG